MISSSSPFITCSGLCIDQGMRRRPPSHSALDLKKLLKRAVCFAQSERSQHAIICVTGGWTPCLNTAAPPIFHGVRFTPLIRSDSVYETPSPGSHTLSYTSLRASQALLVYAGLKLACSVICLCSGYFRLLDSDQLNFVRLRCS